MSCIVKIQVFLKCLCRKMSGQFIELIKVYKRETKAW